MYCKMELTLIFLFVFIARVIVIQVNSRQIKGAVAKLLINIKISRSNYFTHFTQITIKA